VGGSLFLGGDLEKACANSGGRRRLQLESSSIGLNDLQSSTRRLDRYEVEESLFQVFGVKAVLGRTFQPSDAQSFQQLPRTKLRDLAPALLE